VNRATYLVLVVVVVVVVVGETFFKKSKSKALSFQIGSGSNLAGLFLKRIRIDWQSPIFDLTSRFQHGGHDVI